jgi:hypothetical protein
MAAAVRLSKGREALRREWWQRRGERSEIAEDIRAFSAYPKEELHLPMTTNLEQQNKSSSTNLEQQNKSSSEWAVLLLDKR